MCEVWKWIAISEGILIFIAVLLMALLARSLNKADKIHDRATNNEPIR